MKFKSLFKNRRNDDKQVSPNHRELSDSIAEMRPETDNSNADSSDNTENKSDGTVTKLYNLIILDESGSMSPVTRQTISGCNEVLSSIRRIDAEDDSIRQIVSIYCFDSSKSRYIIRNKEISKVKNITEKDYRPNDCTPLYDAIGYTVTQLEEIAKSADSVAKVTIITDGMENASVRWSHAKVVALIEKLKKQGWLFTFMGANIDVEQTSKGLGIDTYMEFEQTEEGMADMFLAENRAHRRYSQKMKFMRSRDFFRGACLENQMEMTGACGDDYFDETERISPEHINKLQPDEIFVFGSNIHGLHDGGAAAMALARFGAVMGQAEGPQGQSYAIQTDGSSIEQLHAAIERFTDYVIQNRDKKFMLTAVGCGAAGYEPHQIAPLFRIAYQFGNVYVPASFLPFVME